MDKTSQQPELQAQQIESLATELLWQASKWTENPRRAELMSRAAEALRGQCARFGELEAERIKWLEAERAQMDELQYLRALLKLADARINKLVDAQSAQAAPQAVQPAVPDLREAVQQYLAAQDALDNREYHGINAEPHEKLMRSRNYARDDLDAALSSTAHPAEGVPVQAEFPTGAIVNGRTHIERLEAHYQFECDAGSLVMCDDWNELKRYFEHLANWAYAATQAAKGEKP